MTTTKTKLTVEQRADMLKSVFTKINERRIAFVHKLIDDKLDKFSMFFDLDDELGTLVALAAFAREAQVYDESNDIKEALSEVAAEYGVLEEIVKEVSK